MRDSLQYLPSIQSERVHNKIQHPLLIIRQDIPRSFQKCEPRIINRIIFEIPEQFINFRIDRTMNPRPAILLKDWSFIQCGVYALYERQELVSVRFSRTLPM